MYWASLPMDRESLRISTLLQPAYQEALQKDITKTELVPRMKIVSKSFLNLILSFFGLQGSGKSYALLFLMEIQAKYGNVELCIDNVCFTITDILKIIEKGDKGEIYCLDEQRHTYGYGSSVERMGLDNVEMTVRAHKLSFFFSAPRLIPHNYHFYFETWEMGSNEEWDMVKIADGEKSIYDYWKYTRLICYDNKGGIIGHIITGAPKDRDFLVKYEEKKDKFINDIRARTGSKRPLYVLDKAYELADYTDPVSKIQFLEEFILKAKTADLKTNFVLVTLAKIGGGDLSIDETKKISHYLGYIIAKEDKFKGIVDRCKAQLLREQVIEKLKEKEYKRQIIEEIEEQQVAHAEELGVDSSA